MKKKNTETVVFRLDPRNPPQMSADEIRALKRMPDKAIDYSEIPQLEGRSWTKPGSLVPTENKKQVTLRLDADVIEFFRGTGKRYQSRMNAVLREYVQANRRAS
jgi:uncharacterized protein (DUF4415 family)